MAHCIGAQGQLKFQNMPLLWSHQEKALHPNQKSFFLSKLQDLLKL